MKTRSLPTGLVVLLALTATAQEKKGIIAEGGKSRRSRLSPGALLGPEGRCVRRLLGVC
jgi:hypothetical protein